MENSYETHKRKCWDSLVQFHNEAPDDDIPRLNFPHSLLREELGREGKLPVEYCSSELLSPSGRVGG